MKDCSWFIKVALEMNSGPLATVRDLSPRIDPITLFSIFTPKPYEKTTPSLAPPAVFIYTEDFGKQSDLMCNLRPIFFCDSGIFHCPTCHQVTFGSVVERFNPRTFSVRIVHSTAGLTEPSKIKS